MALSVPAPSQSRRARAQETRATILAAAGPVFAEAGFTGARTEAIATAAGVTRSLLFYYFKDMRGLYAAVLEDQFRALHQEALGILTAAGSPRAILLRYLDLRFDRVSEKRRYAPLHQQLLTSSNPAARKLVHQYAIPQNQALGHLLARGIREGEFRKIDVRQTVISLNALIIFYFSIAPVLKLSGYNDAYRNDDLKGRKQHILDFVRYGLFRQPELAIP